MANIEDYWTDHTYIPSCPLIIPKPRSNQGKGSISRVYKDPAKSNQLQQYLSEKLSNVMNDLDITDHWESLKKGIQKTPLSGSHTI
ncbi:hypothetical protein Y1Q_0018914 [Alligator mississippiensis]|uniref:Uncharacterized protein n=1 Tax=Alligator mississippiensis TaxID=8496 RepID=A0A151M3A2_ALLMI|nr:hypothetical protein Y1Q_0018914 [Alligator mississippiensis]